MQVFSLQDSILSFVIENLDILRICFSQSCINFVNNVSLVLPNNAVRAGFNVHHPKKNAEPF